MSNDDAARQEQERVRKFLEQQAKNGNGLARETLNNHHKR